ncbi:MAG: protein-L-isoaspartate O-methyltransferase [Hyphomicrobiaceae bacterium]
MDSAVQRKVMVDSQVRPNDVTDRRIPRAMMAVARELFVPANRQSVAYMDGDLVVSKEGVMPVRALLAPRTLAKLMQALDLDTGALVLDIGSATGYSTALLAHMCRQVYGLESDTVLAAKASDAIKSLGLTNAAIETGPLAEGLARRGPYDGILIGGKVAVLPAGLLDQLKDGGKLVAIFDQGGVGKAAVWQRYGTSYDHRMLFDAEAYALPGFELKAEFVF